MKNIYRHSQQEKYPEHAEENLYLKMSFVEKQKEIINFETKASRCEVGVNESKIRKIHLMKDKITKLQMKIKSSE